MNVILQFPWLELAMLVSLVGAVWVSRVRDPIRAAREGLLFTGAVFTLTLLAWLVYALNGSSEDAEWSLQRLLFGRVVFAIDEFNAPLVCSVSILHFMTALATPGSKMRRFSFSWSLAAESIRLATFCCREPGVLVALLTISTIPPFVELVNRGKPQRVFVLHMALFVVPLWAGWALLSAGERFQSAGILLLTVAVLVRCGTVPVHCWVTDWFEHASFGIALLFVAPLSGAYAAVRLVLPIAPDWVLQAISIVSLVTAVYAACMAIVQRETRRFFAYFFLSHSSLVLVGLELQTSISLTASLSLWLSVVLSLGGFGLILRALEARFGRLALVGHHGLYSHVPELAVAFLLIGLACVGFPLTLGFVATEVLVDGAIEANLYIGITVVAVAALNGIAVVRTYFVIFAGGKHDSTISLRVGIREQIVFLTLCGLVLFAGLVPQPGISSRHAVAELLLKDRKAKTQHDSYR